MQLQRLAGLLLVLTLLSVDPVRALYIRPDIESVPLERIVKNLEEQLKEKGKEVQARFNLARAHAMAYALKTDTAQVNKKQPDKGVWFGYEPKHVPFVPKATDDAAKLRAAKEHLAKAIEQYQQVVMLDKNHLTARLGLAWCIDQSQEKDRAIKEYRSVIEAAWEKEKDLKRAGLGWHSVTAEAAGYLTPLLDANKDQAEIQTLKDRIAQMRKVPRPITPIAIPLRDGLNAEDLIDRAARVPFDADGSGERQDWTWITKDAAWLVYDPQAKRQITSALQLFGSVTFWMFWDNGYEALAVLDDDRNGELSGKELAGLALWHDANGNGVSEPGEVRSLTEWGIVSLSCRWERDAGHPEQIAFAPRGVRFRDGSVRGSFDLILQRR